MPTLCRFNDPKGELLDEANVSTQSAPPGQDPRVSRAHEHDGRAEGVGAPSRERSQTADRLSGGLSRRQRLTTSAEFQALFQRGKRIDRPALIVLWRESTESTRVGFAVSRQLRLAVQRNRARRRLREDYRGARSEEHTSELQSRLHLVCRLLLEKKKKIVSARLCNQYAVQARC